MYWKYKAFDKEFAISEGVIKGDSMPSVAVELRQNGLQIIELCKVSKKEYNRLKVANPQVGQEATYAMIYNPKSHQQKHKVKIRCNKTTLLLVVLLLLLVKQLYDIFNYLVSYIW